MKILKINHMKKILLFLFISHCIDFNAQEIHFLSKLHDYDFGRYAYYWPEAIWTAENNKLKFNKYIYTNYSKMKHYDSIYGYGYTEFGLHNCLIFDNYISLIYSVNTNDRLNNYIFFDIKNTDIKKCEGKKEIVFESFIKKRNNKFSLIFSDYEKQVFQTDFQNNKLEKVTINYFDTLFYQGSIQLGFSDVFHVEKIKNNLIICNRLSPFGKENEFLDSIPINLSNKINFSSYKYIRGLATSEYYRIYTLRKMDTACMKKTRTWCDGDPDGLQTYLIKNMTTKNWDFVRLPKETGILLFNKIMCYSEQDKKGNRILKYKNLETNKTWEIPTSSTDVETLLIRDNELYYRIEDKIFKTILNSEGKINKSEQLVQDPIVKHIHWAF